MQEADYMMKLQSGMAIVENLKECIYCCRNMQIQAVACR